MQICLSIEGVAQSTFTRGPGSFNFNNLVVAPSSADHLVRTQVRLLARAVLLVIGPHAVVL